MRIRNLHMANHVFFISPLHTGSLYDKKSQYNYQSIMTQAVGRARRFKQKKLVHVYHFLMSQSIEVNIIEKRTGMEFVKRDNEFKLVKKSDIRATDEVGWKGPSLDGLMEGEEWEDEDVEGDMSE